MLFSVLVGRHDAGFAFVHSRSRARPVTFVPGHFVCSEGKVADFKFSWASKARDEFHVICNESGKKNVSESQNEK